MGVNVARSALFFLFIPRCRFFLLVALVFISFPCFVRVDFSQAVVHNVHVVPMNSEKILMSYEVNRTSRRVCDAAIITPSFFLECWERTVQNALQHLLKPYGCAFQMNQMTDYNPD